MEIEKKNMGSMGLNMLRDNMDQTQKHTETEVAGICTFVKDKRKKWKLQARERVITGAGNVGLISLKRAMEE